MNMQILALLGALLLPTPVVASTTPIQAEIRPIVAIPDELARIAYCESRNVATAKNSSSTAEGRFQFLDSSWAYYGKKLWGKDFIKKDKLNYQDSTELGLYVYNLNGTKDWESSRGCWSALDDD